ncbi:MAG: ASCH domain-containing protein [Methanocorpusculum sp.]|nr:ASCH domain-containing protein [Methanocorpusculum sp.]
MDKAVMLSIRPKWCELIASGKKTIEVRKTRPKMDTPFKCYIYQTRGKWIYKLLERLGLYQGKVIGEFVCDGILPMNIY